VKEKTTIGYLGFRSAIDGGRIFDFSISSTEHANFLASVEIPSELFTGENRIRLQEGVGISYAKLKRLFDLSTLTEVPGPSLNADQVSSWLDATGMKSGTDKLRDRCDCFPAGLGFEVSVKDAGAGKAWIQKNSHRARINF
jgi:hypothetical protein